jgi:hypothetical protein
MIHLSANIAQFKKTIQRGCNVCNGQLMDFRWKRDVLEDGISRIVDPRRNTVLALPAVAPACYTHAISILRMCQVLSFLAFSRREVARLCRARNGECVVENSLSAFFTTHSTEDERRRREHGRVAET